jgi:IclR family acetate operon transcriptional repressor
VQTVDKAMKLLAFFTTTQPEIGLSDLARLAGFDKASTRRLLVSLHKHSFVEQNPETRKYRLGAGFLHLARVREATFPIRTVIQPVLDRLARTTGETAHASTPAGGHLATIGVAEPNRATRVHVDPAEKLPYHATASGIVFLAFSDPGLVDSALDRPLEKHTPHTLTKPDQIRDQVRRAYEDGFAISDQGFEDEVIGMAAPYFGAAGMVAGAVAVATPSSRMTNDVRDTIAGLLIEAAIEITENMGAVPHDHLLQARERIAA